MFEVRCSIVRLPIDEHIGVRLIKKWCSSQCNEWFCKFSESPIWFFVCVFKPKIGCSSSITNRWTCLSLFNVRKMMFELVRPISNHLNLIYMYSCLAVFISFWVIMSHLSHNLSPYCPMLYVPVSFHHFHGHFRRGQLMVLLPRWLFLNIPTWEEWRHSGARASVINSLFPIYRCT